MIFFVCNVHLYLLSIYIYILLTVIMLFIHGVTIVFLIFEICCFTSMTMVSFCLFSFFGIKICIHYKNGVLIKVHFSIWYGDYFHIHRSLQFGVCVFVWITNCLLSVKFFILPHRFKLTKFGRCEFSQFSKKKK